MAEYSILVVEDEHTLRRLLDYRLRKQYDVRTAANGEEALALIEESIPHLIISDIMMPKMDGFALQAALQERKETKAIPFIFLTAKADDQSRLKGMRTGVDDYITKPFDIEQLLSRIERLLERTSIFQTTLDASIGRDFSEKLMPKKLPSVEGYDVKVYNKPKDHGGGDLFDWTQVKPGVFFITIGDVMGKGLQAKFYAYSFLGYVRGTLHALIQSTDSPAVLMKQVNERLMNDEVMEETFASLLLMRWEPAKHSLTYANAGHCRPVLVGPSSTRIVEYSDIILGLDPNAEFKDTTLTLEPGTALMSYTDGLMEQVLKDGSMIGEQGIVDSASHIATLSEPIQSMLSGILDRSQTHEFADDILVFWLQRNA